MPPTSLLCRLDTMSDEDLVGMATAGDDRALAELLSRAGPMVRAKTRTYFLAGGDTDDVIQEGMIGVYKAICDYDRARHPSFRHFADLCVTRQVVTAVRSATRDKHVPLNTYTSLSPVTAAEGDADVTPVLELTDPDSDPATQVVSSAAAAQLRSYCDEVLSEFESQVLLRYLRGDSYQMIAVQLSRGPKAVDNAVQRIKRKLAGEAASVPASEVLADAA